MGLGSDVTFIKVILLTLAGIGWMVRRRNHISAKTLRDDAKVEGKESDNIKEINENSDKEIQAASLELIEYFKENLVGRIRRWKDLDIDIDNFPYYLSERTKDLFLGSAFIHLKRQQFSKHTTYFWNLSNWILLVGAEGTEVYQEALVKAVGRKLEADILILDSDKFLPLDEVDSYSRKRFSTQKKVRGEVVPTVEEGGEPGMFNILAKQLVGLATVLAAGVAANAMSVQSSEGIRGGGGGGGEGGSSDNKTEGRKNVGIRSTKDDATSTASSGATAEQPATRTLNIGDRVMYVNEDGYSADVTAPSRPPRGATGEVVAVYEAVGVRFDAPVPGGHSLSGLCDPQHGHICYASELSLDSGSEEQAFPKLAALTQVISDEVEAGRPLIVFIRQAEQLASTSSRMGSALRSQLSRLQGPLLFVGCHTEEEVEGGAGEEQAGKAGQASSAVYGDTAASSSSAFSLSTYFSNRIVIQAPKAGPALDAWQRAMDRDADTLTAMDNRRMLAEALCWTGTCCDDVDSLHIVNVCLTEEDAEDVIGWAVSHTLQQPGEPTLRNDQLLLSADSVRYGVAMLAAVQDGHTSLQPQQQQAPSSSIKENKEDQEDKEEEKEREKEEEEGERERASKSPSTTASTLKAGDSSSSSSSSSAYLPRLPPQDALTLAQKKLKRVQTDNKFEERILGEVVPPSAVAVSFDAIGALEDVKAALREVVMLPLQRPELFSRGQLSAPCRGVLLFGPPGTGKTLLAKAVATEAGANFINISMATLLSKWLGEAEKSVRAVFSLASKISPCVIFVDEVDSLLGARGGWGEHESLRKVKNEFMACWDGLTTNAWDRVMVLGATNRPFDLDDAIVRRFQRRLMVGLPDAANREKILRVVLVHEELAAGFDFALVAQLTDGFSPSDLKNLCVAAAYQPIREVLEREKKAKEAQDPQRKMLDLESASQTSDSKSTEIARLQEKKPCDSDDSEHTIVTQGEEEIVLAAGTPESGNEPQPTTNILQSNVEVLHTNGCTEDKDTVNGNLTNKRNSLEGAVDWSMDQSELEKNSMISISNQTQQGNKTQEIPDLSVMHSGEDKPQEVTMDAVELSSGKDQKVDEKKGDQVDLFNGKAQNDKNKTISSEKRPVASRNSNYNDDIVNMDDLWHDRSPRVQQATLRPLCISDFRLALKEVSASTTHEASTMSDLYQWNELYGQGGSRKKTALSYFL